MPFYYTLAQCMEACYSQAQGILPNSGEHAWTTAAGPQTPVSPESIRRRAPDAATPGWMHPAYMAEGYLYVQASPRTEARLVYGPIHLPPRRRAYCGSVTAGRPCFAWIATHAWSALASVFASPCVVEKSDVVMAVGVTPPCPPMPLP